MNMSCKTEFPVPDTLHPTRSRSTYPALVKRLEVAVLPLRVSERRKMYEPEKGGGKGEKDPLLGQDRTDGSEKIFKRRHTTRERVSRGSSFNRSKKLRQDPSTGELGNITHSPQSRHKQQASLSSVVLPPLWQRLRHFGHYDLQSATLERFGSGKGSSGDRLTRKKPTGASAAHIGVTPQDCEVETLENSLVAICPAFRNEIGGDSDWAGVQDNNNKNPLLSLRGSLSHDKQKRVGSRAKMLLEGSIPSDTKKPSEPQVLQVLQPQSSIQFPFEFIDFGALYYRNHFYQQDHQNFFGVDDNNGPIAVSLKRERISDDLIDYFDTMLNGSQASPPKHQYRVIVRTSELETLRGTILEDSIPSGTKIGTSRGLPPRDVIEYISQGEFHVGCLKIGKQEKKVSQELMRLDEQELNNKYKIGILYCKRGQKNEEEMYNNENGSPAFEDFLKTIGHKVAMKGFTKYRAQLDNKTDTTGAYSVYTEHQGAEIMFHVSTYLPHTPSNSQQLLRKRHIGNDIVTVIFQEPGCTPFSPKVIRSHFQHIFVIVRVENPGTDYTKYRVAVTRSQDIPYFGPPIPEGAVFDKNEQFKEFFLTKLINACNASLRSEKFATMATRTRRQYLLDLCETSCTSSTIEQASTSGLVAGLLSKNWGGKKREKPHLQGPLVYTPGALVWNVAIIMKKGKPLPFSEEHDTAIDCMMVLGADLLAFVYTNTKDSILHIPTKDISGWCCDERKINLFYDGSSCLSLEIYEPEDVRDIVCRLQALGPCVTASHEATLMEFHRGSNNLLGLVINEAGEVKRVDPQAKHIGLQLWSRILQVEDKLICTHKHSEITKILTDINKNTVKAYVIPPVPSTHRELMYYPCVNWPAIWASRPTHINGDSEEQTQNGTEPMDTSESSVGSGSVALRPKRKAATIHVSHPQQRSSYHEAVRSNEMSQLDEDDDEPIYDRLRATENQSSQANVYRRSRSPKPPSVRDNMGFTRVRGRVYGARDHVPAQQIEENIRATERARSAGPSPEPLEHRLDYYGPVSTHITNSSFLTHSQPHTTVPLSSLKRRSDKVMIEILDPTSPPMTPGSVHELTKKFSFNSPPQSNKTSPSRNSSSVGGAKPPMRATVATSEMTRSNIPIPARLTPTPLPKKLSSSPESDVQMRTKRKSNTRPASWDASLIFNCDNQSTKHHPTNEEGESEDKQFSRKENGRLPIRKKSSPVEGGEEKMEDEPSTTGEKLSQEELKRISVKERTQRWEARGSEVPSFFTLPKSFRSKGGNGSSSPMSPNSPLSPSSGSRIPAPRASSAAQYTTLTQSLKARNMYSKQSTPPIQEETDCPSSDGHDTNERVRNGREAETDKDDHAHMQGSTGVKMGSFVGGKVGVVSQMRGSKAVMNRSSSQVTIQTERQTSPTRATSPPRKGIPVRSTRSPSPTSPSKIPSYSSQKRTSEGPLKKFSPPPGSSSNRGPLGQNSSRTVRNSLDSVVLESSLHSLRLSDNERLLTKENTNKKVEDWLRQSSPATVSEDTSLPGKQDMRGGDQRLIDQYRKSVHNRSVVKTAMI